MIKFHPSERLLKLFAAGELSAGLGLAVSVHLEYCKDCRESVREYEFELAEKALNKVQPEVEENVSFDGMLENIFNLADEQGAKPSQDARLSVKPEQQKIKMLQVGQHKFKLPKILSDRSEQKKRWHSIGGVHTKSIGDFDEYKANLIYIEPATDVPPHTHKSLELTVVLSGSFKDEHGEYNAGDFIVVDDTVEHSPVTFDSKCCLCLSVMDEPMHFTQGKARLLNPLARLMF
ncbi:ChrR family anti-sigma-E factor [Gayadomonas joobiniege]|uniref:ChrR family anti-sigma-E factor n=1 Tax=Gayadomonas joobiniege TaxID=1234606 RepID=UPI000378FA8A|nr:ChrR family anti-sigma-E factor [Gayadomonas joobiniege]